MWMDSFEPWFKNVGEVYSLSLQLLEVICLLLAKRRLTPFQGLQFLHERRIAYRVRLPLLKLCHFAEHDIEHPP